MNKYLLVAFSLFHGVVFSQESTSISLNCMNAFTVSQKVGVPQGQEYAVIEFDFSTISDAQDLKSLVLEIQPMNDCFNGTTGEKYGQIVTINLKELLLSKKNARVGMDFVQRKCFNWRIVASKNNSGTSNCESSSDWNFTPFIY